MSAFLHPCPGCARHVRSHDATCPFCEAELPPGFAKTRPVKIVPHHQITRAMIAFAGVTTLAGCFLGGAASDYGTTILDNASFGTDAADASGDALDAQAPKDAGNAGDANDGG